MTDFGDWIRKWGIQTVFNKHGTGPDLANLCAQQHEALAGTSPWVFSDAMGDVWVCLSCEEQVEILDVTKNQHNTEDGCTYQAALDAARALQEKYSHD